MADIIEPEGTIVGNKDWDGMRRPEIFYAMSATFCGVFLAVLDGSICNVVLPNIALELGVNSSDSIWIVNAFQLVIMMTLLPFAALGELIGYKKVYIIGLGIFTAGSLLCALSHSFAMLVGSRVFQGVGASMIMSINTSLVKLIYPKRHLGKGVGINATIVAIASVVGPTLSAAILSIGTWHWLFAINIPVGIAAFIVSYRFLPENPTKVIGRKFNFRSSLLNAATFGLFIGTIEAYSHGTDIRYIAIGTVLLFIVGYIFVHNQLKEKYPILPFDLLSIPIFSASVLTSILSFTAQMLGMIAMPFMLTHSFGYNAVETGLLMTSWPAVIIVAAPAAGWLVGKVHPGILGAVGLSLMSIGCFLLAFIPDNATYSDFVWRLILCGLGFGIFQSPNNSILLSSAPTHRSGSAGGMLATARLIGQTTGAALVALMFHISTGSAPHNALLLAGFLTLAATAVSLFRKTLRMPNI